VILQVSRADDPAVTAYRFLGDPQWLRARGLFVAEGRLVVDRLLAGGRYRVESVLATPAALGALESRLIAVDAPVLIAPPAMLEEITGFNFHRGCLALAERQAPADLDAIAGGRLLLGLEAIGNPDNIGSLFRTAAAFGVDGVLVDGRTADPFYRKSLRTSMGAVLDLPFTEVVDWPAVFDRLRAQGFTVVALTPHPTALALLDFTKVLPVARLLLMVGAEGPGLTPDAIQAADYRLRIPVVGVDSLNVTVAAGIALARIVETRFPTLG
jgi:tRNA G18 (ribose-2'-O)-methylase SpoU